MRSAREQLSDNGIKSTRKLPPTLGGPVIKLFKIYKIRIQDYYKFHSPTNEDGIKRNGALTFALISVFPS